MGTKAKDLQTEGNPALTDYIINERVGGPGIQPRKTLLQAIFDLFVASGLGTMTVASGIVAAGANQAGATSLTKTRNRVDTVPAGSGVKEDGTNPVTRTVQNNCGTGEDLKWYPSGTDQFYITGSAGLQGAGVAIIIADGNSAAYIRYSNGVLTLQG